MLSLTIRGLLGSRDVSFKVEQGEVLGLIDVNGAVVSTLASSRINSSQLVVRSHLMDVSEVSLEVGTGFHPELSGRGNIFLNGAILGMHRSEFKPSSMKLLISLASKNSLKPQSNATQRYGRGLPSVAAHLET